MTLGRIESRGTVCLVAARPGTCQLEPVIGYSPRLTFSVHVQPCYCPLCFACKLANNLETKSCTGAPGCGRLPISRAILSFQKHLLIKSRESSCFQALQSAPRDPGAGTRGPGGARSQQANSQQPAVQRPEGPEPFGPIGLSGAGGPHPIPSTWASPIPMSSTNTRGGP